uniref:Uncharacterized protein n=1 Tax=Solanum lycopersicum TaxID=4081 RepID=A0A3Q7G9E4_SOLLC
MQDSWLSLAVASLFRFCPNMQGSWLSPAVASFFKFISQCHRSATCWYVNQIFHVDVDLESSFGGQLDTRIISRWYPPCGATGKSSQLYPVNSAKILSKLMVRILFISIEYLLGRGNTQLDQLKSPDTVGLSSLSVDSSQTTGSSS